jgi:hypothetical protein
MQVCVNGHQITDCADSQPESRQKFCKDCGAKTIDACLHCSSKVRGHHHLEGVSDYSTYPAPRYCIECGEPYPWQVSAIDNLKEVLKESELSAQDLQELDKALPDILRDTPKTESASLKMKRIFGKMGKPLYEVAMKVVTDIASETAKKTLGLKEHERPFGLLHPCLFACFHESIKTCFQ